MNKQWERIRATLADSNYPKTPEEMIQLKLLEKIAELEAERDALKAENDELRRGIANLIQRIEELVGQRDLARGDCDGLAAENRRLRRGGSG